MGDSDHATRTTRRVRSGRQVRGWSIQSFCWALWRPSPMSVAAGPSFDLARSVCAKTEMVLNVAASVSMILLWTDYWWKHSHEYSISPNRSSLMLHTGPLRKKKNVWLSRVSASQRKNNKPNSLKLFSVQTHLKRRNKRTMKANGFQTLSVWSNNAAEVTSRGNKLTPTLQQITAHFFNSDTSSFLLLMPECFHYQNSKGHHEPDQSTRLSTAQN